MHMFMHDHVEDKNIIKVYYKIFSNDRSNKMMHESHECTRQVC